MSNEKIDQLTPAVSALDTDETIIARDGTNYSVTRGQILGPVPSTAPTNGQLLIGNTSTGSYAPASLTAGSGISITPGASSLTIAATNSGTVTSITAGTGLTGGTITTSGTIALASPVAVANGGTGLTGTPTNGQLPIGNGSGYTLASLTAGSGISITPGAGSISIAATNSGTVTSITAGTGLTGGTITSTGTIALSSPVTVANGGTGLTGTPTNGQLPIGNGSGYTLAPITAGANVTVTNSAGGITIAAAGGSGSFVLLEAHTASNSASLAFTNWYSSSYDVYEIQYIGLVPATNNVGAQLQCSTNGGSSYDTGVNYANAYSYGYNNSSGGGGSSNTYIGIGNVGNAIAHYALNGKYTLYQSSGNYPNFIGQLLYLNTGVGTSLALQLGSLYGVASTVNAFLFSFSSGNITSGTIRVYGIAH